MMKKNVGSADRWFRVSAGIALLLCSVLGPFPMLLRVFGFGAMGGYALLTGLVGSCLGYRLMGKSSCPVKPLGGVS